MPMNQVIQERRRELGFTQEQVAAHLGVTAPAVNKWEKGSTCPDITLLPALARLLEVDLNTLLCFQETLTPQDILRFQEEVMKEIKEKGMEAGFLLAEQKIREYPNCGALLEGMANLLEGNLIMSALSEDAKEAYQPRLTAWYERAMECGDETVRNRVGFMIVSRCLQNRELEKARQLLEQLPEPTVLNRDVFQARLYREEGNLEEAAKLLEKTILQQMNSIQGMLWNLIDVELELDADEIAEKIAQKAREAARIFDMWGYNGLVGFQSVAKKKKDVKANLELLEQIFAAIEKPWNVNQSPLYHRMYEQNRDSVSIGNKMLTPLLALLESDPEYDFLRTHEEFQRLLERYRRKLSGR